VAEQRYLLTIAYQAGRDERISKGADGARDFFTPAELEKAAWSFLQDGGGQVGLFHANGTEGAARVVESYIWRGAPWTVTANDGTEVVVKSGDWLVGMICDPVAWNLVKAGHVAGVSPQGAAKRRRSQP
jgi:putative serine protease XkdF